MDADLEPEHLPGFSRLAEDGRDRPDAQVDENGVPPVFGPPKLAWVRCLAKCCHLERVLDVQCTTAEENVGEDRHHACT
eukprot:10047661-Lingulodinium_polyedra.AAC.1